MSEQPPVKQHGDALENLYHERRSFPPSAEFAASAVAQPGLYEEAEASGPEFWAKQARELLSWDEMVFCTECQQFSSDNLLSNFTNNRVNRYRPKFGNFTWTLNLRYRYDFSLLPYIWKLATAQGKID